jgi:hypothetical protein
MLPSYAPGDTVLGLRWFKPAVGQVVVANGPTRKLIKRLMKYSNSTIWLEGDNKLESTDSRHFGRLPGSTLEAKIILKL